MNDKSSSSWTHLEQLPGIWQASYAFPGGLSRSLILALPEDDYLVYSPGESLAELAQRQVLMKARDIFLLEPNSFHSLGLAPWRAYFPKARSFAASPAVKRLAKKTGITSEPLELLKAFLPEHIKIIEVPESKIGEVWLTVSHIEKKYWIVGDAFFNFSKIADKGFLKWFMQLNRMGPGLETSRLFNAFGIKDKKVYSEWLKLKIKEENPVGLIPCHGKIIEDENLPHLLLGLVNRRY